MKTNLTETEIKLKKLINYFSSPEAKLIRELSKPIRDKMYGKNEWRLKETRWKRFLARIGWI